MPLTVCLSGTEEAGGPSSRTLRTLASPPGLSPSGSVTCHITPCSLGSSNEEEKCGSRRSANFSPAPISISLPSYPCGQGQATPGGRSRGQAEVRVRRSPGDGAAVFLLGAEPACLPSETSQQTHFLLFPHPRRVFPNPSPEGFAARPSGSLQSA